MTAFRVRTVEGQLTLSERLRYRRCSLDLTEATVCATLGITPHYLNALEAGQYEALPGEVYVRSFLRRYGHLLSIRPEELIEQFEHEIEALGIRKDWRIIARTSSIRTASWRVRGLFIGLVVIVTGGYLAWQLITYLTPPPLTVELPKGIVRGERVVQITGATDPEVTVSINGVIVTKSPDGTFSEALSLTPGIQTISVRAERRFGRPHIISEQLIVE